MPCRGLPIWLILSLVLSGCAAPEKPTRLVTPNSLGQPAPPAPVVRQAAFAPGSNEAAQQVDTIGRKVIDANKQAGVRPQFRTVGIPELGITHRGTEEIYVTEGLVRQCKTEGELAAVLCAQLGKMVSEREAVAGVRARVPERQAPLAVPVGNEYGTGGPADKTDLAEQWKFDRGRRQAASAASLPPDPQKLAGLFLQKAGYAPGDLAAAEPLLQAAAANAVLDRQLNPTTSGRP